MVDHAIIAEILSNVFLFLLMFGMSATVEFGSLVNQLKNRYAIITGIGMQFLIMPLLGFLAVKFFNNYISPAVGMTLLVVCSSPGGSYSNWWCSIFNADLALSVAMTALSTLFSTFLLPANLMLYSHLSYGGDKELMHAVDWKTLFITLTVVLFAIVVGLAASYRFRSRRFRRWANRFGTLSGMLLVLFSIVLSSASDEGALWDQPGVFYMAVAFPCVVGLVLANCFGSLARLKKPEQVTVSVECCYQNVGIATSVAVAMFDNSNARGEALCVPMYYGFVEAVLLGAYCIIAWKVGWTKAPPNEKLWVVLGISFEVGPDSSNEDMDESFEKNKDETNESLRGDATFENSTISEEIDQSNIPGRVRLDTEEEVAHPSSLPAGRIRLDTEEEVSHPSSLPGGRRRTETDEEEARMEAIDKAESSVSVTKKQENVTVF